MRFVGVQLRAPAPVKWCTAYLLSRSDARLRSYAVRTADYVGELTIDKLRELDAALLIALGIPASTRPLA